MSCVWMLQRGHSGDGCVLASTLCKYDLRKGDLFVLSWARVRRVSWGSLSSELLVCGEVCAVLCYCLVMIMIYVSNRHYLVIQFNSLYSLEIL